MKVTHVHFKQLNTCHLVLPTLKKTILMSSSHFSYAVFIYSPLKKSISLVPSANAVRKGRITQNVIKIAMLKILILNKREINHTV